MGVVAKARAKDIASGSFNEKLRAETNKDLIARPLCHSLLPAGLRQVGHEG